MELKQEIREGGVIWTLWEAHYVRVGPRDVYKHINNIKR